MTIPLADASVPTLVARTTQISYDGELTALVPDDIAPADIVCWVRGGDGLVGWGRAASITTSGQLRFSPSL